MPEVITLEQTLQNLVTTARKDHHNDMWGPYHILDVSLATDVEVPPYSDDCTVVVTFSYNWSDDKDLVSRTSQMVYALMTDGLWACWMD